jgi:hypothetical protein
MVFTPGAGRAVTRGLTAVSDVLTPREREQQRGELGYVIRTICSPCSYGGRGASASSLPLGTEAAVRPPPPSPPGE